MSQTHTPHEASAADESGSRRGRRRTRRRADSHSGDRCRMCRQTVIVDDEGRCQLGHQVVPRTEMAQRLADREAQREAPPQPLGDAAEIDLDRELPPTVPASFSTALPATGGRPAGEGTPHMSDDPAPHVDDPIVVLDTTPSGPTQDAVYAPTSSGPAQDAAHAPTPPHGLARPTLDQAPEAHDLTRPAREPQRRWVPGVQLAGRRLEGPSYLPAAATSRPTTAGEPRLPVMEALPPLPPPPPPDGPQVARSLFHQALGDHREPDSPTEPVDATEPTDATEPVDATEPTDATERVDATEPTGPTSPANPQPLAAPLGPQEPWAVVLPGPPAPSALPEQSSRLSPADLTPEAASVLDLELPVSPPRADPVYELEPVGEDVIPPRGPLQILAGGVFVVLLLSAAWYLATSL